MVLELVADNVTTPQNCQILFTFLYVFAYIAVASSSLLIALRAIAIWNKSKVVVGLASSVWLTNLSFLVLGITKIHSTWVPALSSCSSLDVESNKATMIVLFVSDIVLLLTMLFGLLRLRRYGGGTFELARLLWTQGVIWLMLATIAEVTPVVFMCLNLNDAFDMMFLMPALMTMSIAATRMYRSLADFGAAADITRGSEGPQRIGHTAPNARLTSNMPISYRQMEVAVHTAYEQYPGFQTDQHVSYIGMDGQLGEKPRGLSFDDDLESRRG
ncbi:hypothetical protein BJV74DRAFT_868749 [Russula compacta]|nr:hypothetical protein BJV74DRAFT_868749 [Russula compacta]